MGTELKEVKTLVLQRVPPGDRWVFASGNGENIYPSLTDALEAWFQQNGDTQFYMDARKGTVEIVKTEEIEVIKPINKYSLYGEN
jgi:hypothetical protein